MFFSGLNLGCHVDMRPFSLLRQGRVVWFQEETDGLIAGVAFLNPRVSDSGAPPSH